LKQNFSITGLTILTYDTFSVHGDEASTTDDAVSYPREMKILEQINNEWKLVAQSIHAYKP